MLAVITNHGNDPILLNHSIQHRPHPSTRQIIMGTHLRYSDVVDSLAIPVVHLEGLPVWGHAGRKAQFIPLYPETQ